MTLRLRRRGSRFFSMTEGRKSQIILLDERRLDIIIQPKLHSYELLDLVASHFKLREKHYFGLGFLDDTNHFSWLQADKRVLEHDFPKKTGLLVIYFSIRFYVETIGLLRDIQTVELFYLNGRQVLFKGPEECDSETVFELAAHVLQATNGDFVSEEETREELKKLPLILTSALKEHPSITYCEDRVICQYEKLVGTSRGLAIVNYMTIIENLPTYGIHFYEVKDKKDIPWWLGISPKGIAVYDKVDRKTPRKLFTWKHLENLYYRDRKFSIEVSSPKRDESGNQMSVSRRTFGASNVDVHAWFAATSQLTKGIWSMAVAQHQFYLDRKQSKSQLPTARSMSEIAADLCRSTASLPGSMGSDLSRSPSSHSLPSLSNSRYDLTIEQSDSLKAEREMVKALRARKEALEEALAKRTEELKQLCFEEGQLTGVLPHDTPPMAPGETVPTFRRRVGTAFSLSVKDKGIDSESSDLSNLELEVDLQGKITSAAHRLASDKTVSKYVRKQRKQSYIKSATKLKEMEKKLGDMRRQIGKFSGPEDHHHPHHHPSSTSSSTSSSSHQQRCKEGMYNDDVVNAESSSCPSSPSTKSPTIDLLTTTTTTTTTPHHHHHHHHHPGLAALVSSDQCSNKDTDSCGNSIYSADYSTASSLSLDDSEGGSVNYILHTCRSSTQLRLNNKAATHSSSSSPSKLRASSSQCSSLSASSVLSYSISDVSERLDMLVEINTDRGGNDDDSEKRCSVDSDDGDNDDMDNGEDYSIVEAEKNMNVGSHFVLSRNRDDPRTLRRGGSKDLLNRSRVLAKFDEIDSENDSVASSEYETAESVTSNDSRVRGTRQRAKGTTSTLVERRRQTYITGTRAAFTNQERLARTCSINDGYKMFEKRCLEAEDRVSVGSDMISAIINDNGDDKDGPSFGSPDNKEAVRRPRYNSRGRNYLPSNNVSFEEDSMSVTTTTFESRKISLPNMGVVDRSPTFLPSNSSSQHRVKLTRPLPFSPSLSTSSSTSSEIKDLSFSSQGGDTDGSYSRRSSTRSRGRTPLAFRSCTRVVPRRSPSPPNNSKSRLLSTQSSSVSNSSSSTRSTSTVISNDDRGRSVSVTVKERRRPVIYTAARRSKTPDLRRTQSNLNPPLSSAPLVLEENFDDSVFLDEKNTDADVRGAPRNNEYKCNKAWDGYPIRRGLSCPSINEQLSHSTGSAIETVV